MRKKWIYNPCTNQYYQYYHFVVIWPSINLVSIKQVLMKGQFSRCKGLGILREADNWRRHSRLSEREPRLLEWEGLRVTVIHQLCLLKLPLKIAFLRRCFSLAFVVLIVRVFRIGNQLETARLVCKATPVQRKKQSKPVTGNLSLCVENWPHGKTVSYHSSQVLNLRASSYTLWI